MGLKAIAAQTDGDFSHDERTAVPPRGRRPPVRTPALNCFVGFWVLERARLRFTSSRRDKRSQGRMGGRTTSFPAGATPRGSSATRSAMTVDGAARLGGRASVPAQRPGGRMAYLFRFRSSNSRRLWSRKPRDPEAEERTRPHAPPGARHILAAQTKLSMEPPGWDALPLPSWASVCEQEAARWAPVEAGTSGGSCRAVVKGYHVRQGWGRRTSTGPAAAVFFRVPVRLRPGAGFPTIASSASVQPANTAEVGGSPFGVNGGTSGSTVPGVLLCTAQLGPGAGD